jgi:hypothetical protein
MKNLSIIFTSICLMFMVPGVLPAQPAGRWIMADNHKHTSSSDGSGTAITAATEWKSVGFNYLLITDHGNYGEYENGNIATANTQHDPAEFKVGIGIEWAKRPHFVCMYQDPVNQPMPGGYQDPFWSAHGVSSSSYEGVLAVIEWVDSLGGHMYVAHPGTTGSSYNAYTKTLDSLLEMAEHGLKGFEAFNGGNAFTWNQARHIWRAGGLWDEILKRGYRFAAYSGSDSHGTSAYNGFGGNRAYILSQTITDEAYFEALQAGRFYMVAEYHSGAPFAIIMNATVGDSMMGSTVRVGGGAAELRVQASLDTAHINSVNKLVIQIDTIKVISDGNILWMGMPNAKTFDSTISVPVSQNTYVRVEVLAKNLSSGGVVRALSNPIYLEPGTVNLVSGTNNAQSLSLAICPNPSHKAARISFAPLAEKSVLRIYSPLGRLVSLKTIMPLQKEMMWDGSGFNSGTYLLQINRNGKTYSKRLVLVN